MTTTVTSKVSYHRAVASHAANVVYLRILLLIPVAFCLNSARGQGVTVPIPQQAWAWAPVTQEAYLQILEARDVLSRFHIKSQPTLLRSEHPLTREAQKWVDGLDDHLRKNMPDQMKHVVKPTVYVLDAPRSNGFTLATPVICHPNVQLLFAHGTGTSRDLVSLFGQPCPTNENLTTMQVRGFVMRFSDLSGGCRLSTLPAKQKEMWRFLVTGQCELTAMAKEQQVSQVNGWYGWYPHPVMVGAITLFSGTFSSGRESLAGLLFHELAHYYLAHSVLEPRTLWLQWSTTGPPQPLPEDSPLQALGHAFDETCTNSSTTSLESDGDADPVGSSSVCQSLLTELKAKGLVKYTLEDIADDWAYRFMHDLEMDPTWLLVWLARHSIRTCPTIDSANLMTLMNDLSMADYTSDHHTVCYRINRLSLVRKWL